MKFRKLVSTALAGVMALSLTVPAFAAANVTSSEPTNVEVSGTTSVPTIAVTIPTTAAVVVNPYQLEVTQGSDTIRDQVIFATQYIKSETNAALDVTATVTGKVEGNAAFATASTQGGKAVSTNSVFMYLEVGAATADDGTGDPTWATAYDKTNTSQLLVNTTANTGKAPLIQMPAGDSTTPSYAAFSLRGDAADQPTTPWASTDKVGATIAFTFTPVMAEKYTITIGTVTGGTVTASATSAFADQEITLTGTPTTAGQTATYTVTAEDGSNVTVTGGKFDMPAQNVTVTATFA